jgi:glycosyltransferase involved in cell wall biosynthesis
MKTAVLIPCYNEEQTINNVVSDFRKELPDAEIYVYDNNSTDNTVKEAERAGAIVRFEKQQGKGNVIKRMFREIEADIYVIVDGDSTYPADRVHDLIKPIIRHDADMVIGSRLEPSMKSHFKLLNRIGNNLFIFIVNLIFKVRVGDLLSGYRVLSRDVAKSLPITSKGFEVETEITVKCFEANYVIKEVPVKIISRPKGSKSKIKIFNDGFLILNTIITLFRDYKPLTAFGIISILFIIAGLFFTGFLISEYLLVKGSINIGLVLLSFGFFIIGFITFFSGLIIHTIARRFQELDLKIRRIIETHKSNSGN